jgi:hypothetical protein
MDWLAHTPRDVLAKNFRTSEANLKNLPASSTISFQHPDPVHFPEIRSVV